MKHPEQVMFAKLFWVDQLVLLYCHYQTPARTDIAVDVITYWNYSSVTVPQGRQPSELLTGTHALSWC